MLMGVGIACIMLMPGMEGHLKKVILSASLVLNKFKFAVHMSYLMFRVATEAFWSFVCGCFLM